ncbi:MAG: glycosyltransferase, partial [Waddliaceae bacterium]
HVKLHGPCGHREVIKKCQSAHLFVLPCIEGSDGNKDGLPVSITEALACDLPVITTPTTGIPEVVRNGHNGLMVPENDAQALSEAIESLICNPGLYNSLRSHTRTSVETAFDIKKTSEMLKNLFANGKL